MNAECAYFVHTCIIPAALSVLPAQMTSPEAQAMLLAIGLQESRFQHRKQIGGPAVGFWQFERGGGVKGVLTHHSTAPIVRPLLSLLNYQPDEREVYAALPHNDVLAAIFARLLLWTVPGRLPTANQHELGWTQYLSGWRPGKPHVGTWFDFYAEAWRIVTTE